MDDQAFEALLADAFQTPTDRPGRWAVAAAVEGRLRRRTALRRAVMAGATGVGVAITGASLAAAGALGPIGRLAGEAAAQAQAVAHQPVILTLLGLALLTAAMGGVLGRD